jgi:hypothetical protein
MASTFTVALLALSVYAVGKTFFWPTMLGVVAEQFPKGGALTLNSIGAVGMLCVGVIGTVFLGNIQDKATDRDLLAKNPGLHAKVAGVEKTSVFGKYRPLDTAKIEQQSADDKTTIETIANASKKSALSTVAVFPCIMLVCYLILIFYFKAKGGYKAQVLESSSGGG